MSSQFAIQTHHRLKGLTHLLLTYLTYLPSSALKLTGPFVVMIYKMISGDMFTFSIIYGIMLLGFSEAFYFLNKHPKMDKDSKYASYRSTWMALFHMTLGDYDVSAG